MVIDQWPMCYM